jgi:hypothetical protein
VGGGRGGQGIGEGRGGKSDVCEACPPLNVPPPVPLATSNAQTGPLGGTPRACCAPWRRAQGVAGGWGGGAESEGARGFHSVRPLLPPPPQNPRSPPLSSSTPPNLTQWPPHIWTYPSTSGTRSCARCRWPLAARIKNKRWEIDAAAAAAGSNETAAVVAGVDGWLKAAAGTAEEGAKV